MRLGSWELGEELGRGGMGVVHRARDAAGREAAVKLITAPGDPELLLRFGREVEVLRRLDHPGAVRVLDAGQEAGRPWLAMEHVPGETLESRLAREGMLDARDAAWIVARLARALDHAHARGVVHRDVKPGNVLLRPDGEPVLTDFGLAAVCQEAGRQRLTATGALMGTPGYLAPEQASADGASPGPACDVYGLGATLFALLTGGPPFRGEDAIQVLAAVARASAPSPRELRPGLDPALCRLVQGCLAKDPAERPHSAGALALALEAWLAAPRASARSSGWLALAGLAAAAIAAGAIALAPSPPPPSVAVIAPSGPPPLPPPAPTPPAPLPDRLPTRAPDSLERAVWARPDDARAWEALLRARRERGELRAAARVAECIPPALRPALAAELAAVVDALLDRGRSGALLTRLDDVDTALKVLPTFRGWWGRWHLYERMGDVLGATHAAEQALALRPDEPQARVALASCQIVLEPQRALETVGPLLRRPDAPALAHAIAAQALRSEGRLEEALAAAERARACEDGTLSHLTMAYALFDLGRDEEALAAAGRAVSRATDPSDRAQAAAFTRAARHALDGPHPAPQARPALVRGAVAAYRGDDGTALAGFEEALRLDPQAVGPRLLRGRLRLGRGEPLLALEDAREASARAAAGQGAWSARILAARALAVLGRRDEALAAAAEAERVEPPIHDVRLDRAALRLDLGEPAAARAELAITLEGNPSSAEGWSLLSQALGSLGDAQGEVAAMVSAVAAAPADARVRRSASALCDRLLPRGEGLLRAGDVPGALRDLEALVTLRGSDPSGWAALALARRGAGDLEGALAAGARTTGTPASDTRGAVEALAFELDPLALLLQVEAARRGRPDWGLLHVRRVQLLLRLGWVEDALTASEEALARLPADPEARTARALALRKAGRLEDAEAEHARALELASPELREVLRRDWAEAW